MQGRVDEMKAGAVAGVEALRCLACTPAGASPSPLRRPSRAVRTNLAMANGRSVQVREAGIAQPVGVLDPSPSRHPCRSRATIPTSRRAGLSWLPQEVPALRAARPAGFEPAALGFVVRYSIQLSYGRVQSFVERREWDSNPRYRLSPYTGLANQRLRPLGHLSRSCGGPGAACCLLWLQRLRAVLAATRLESASL